jgi:hypothetical protein
VLDEATRANREPTTEERRLFDGMMVDVDRMGDDITRSERLEAAQRSLTERRGRQLEGEQPGRRPDGVITRGAAVEMKGEDGLMNKPTSAALSC